MTVDIPVVDLSGIALGGDRRREAAFQIDRACREIGFFTVTGHGVGSVIGESYAALKEFFALPLSEKEGCRPQAGDTLPGSDYTPYGYSGLLEENAFAFMGVTGKPNDYVEKFSAGRLIRDDATRLPFPPGPIGERLRRHLRDYYLTCESLAFRIAELLTIPLGLAPDYFTRRIDASEDSMRAHYYPAFADVSVTDQGMGEHTDSTLFTLLTHTAPGIQVQTREGIWITPEFRSVDEFVVNIGDLLQHWSGREYVSTPHRVVLSPSPRHSIVFFKLTNDDELVETGNRQMDALFGRAYVSR